jgi:hypothetical protein
MICEAERDGQRRNLPQPNAKVVDVGGFLRDLNLSYLQTFTTIFTNIDSVCYHAVQNEQAEDNVRAIGLVYQASTLAAQYLTDLTGKLSNFMATVKGQMEHVSETFGIEIESFAHLLYSSLGSPRKPNLLRTRSRI